MNPSSPVWIANQIAQQNAARVALSHSENPGATVQSVIAGILIAIMIVAFVYGTYVMWREWR